MDTRPFHELSPPEQDQAAKLALVNIAKTLAELKVELASLRAAVQGIAQSMILQKR